MTDRAISTAKPKAKPYKVFDTAGLYLIVAPTGSKWWRFKYAFDGREKLLSLGTYPDVSLRAARDRRDDARRQVAAGVDPSANRKAERSQREDDFETAAREVLSKQAKSETESTAAKKRAWLEQHVLPYLGKKALAAISSLDVLAVLERIEKRGRHETAHRVRAQIRDVFDFAVAKGKVKHNPVDPLRKALAPVVTESRAAITSPARFGNLLRAIDTYTGQPGTVAALKMMPHVFVRSIELRGASWGEFDLDGKEPLWRIPAGRMKMDDEHLVPLSRQVVAILREIQPLSDRGPASLVFPSLRPGRPLSENTLTLAIRQLGFAGDEHSTHGFRASANSLLVERGFPPELVSLQLAHKPKSEVERAYNRATRLAERRKMLQSWSNYLDALKRGGEIVSIRRDSAS